MPPENAPLPAQPAPSIGQVAAAGKNLDAFIRQVELHAVTIELDLVDPASAGRHLFDRGSQRRLDESGEGRFDADCRGLFALKRHPLDQAQRKLPKIVPFVPLDKILDVGWHVAHLQVAAPAQSWVTFSDTSADQPSAVLKPMTRIGSRYWPLNRSWMTVSRSTAS
jgi:hypothetical protein